MTAHWLEAFIDHDEIGARLICSNPTNCEDTDPDHRSLGCAVVSWWEGDPSGLLDWPLGDQRVFGRIQIAAKWFGYGEDSELYLVPPS
jgi:hypothetical protein